MTRMKKLTSVLLAMTMAASLMVPVWAIEKEPQNINQSNREQDGMIVHTLKRTLSAVSENAVKEALIGLGMDERVVARMESDVLEELAAAEEIHAVIAYYEIEESIDIHKEIDLYIAKEWILENYTDRDNAVSS